MSAADESGFGSGTGVPTPSGKTPASSGRWVEMPLPQVEEPDLEAVRRIAYEMAMHWDFHEIAIQDPFAAESWVKDKGAELVRLVGWPEGFAAYDYVDDALEAGVSLSPEEPVGSEGDPKDSCGAAASAGEGDTDADR